LKRFGKRNKQKRQGNAENTFNLKDQSRGNLTERNHSEVSTQSPGRHRKAKLERKKKEKMKTNKNHQGKNPKILRKGGKNGCRKEEKQRVQGEVSRVKGREVGNVGGVQKGFLRVFQGRGGLGQTT